jgi:hypothetical protein
MCRWVVTACVLLVMLQNIFAAPGMTPQEEAFLRQIYMSKTSTWDQAVIDARSWTNFHATYSNTLYSLLSQGITNFVASYGTNDSVSVTGHTGYIQFNTNVPSIAYVDAAVQNVAYQHGTNNFTAPSNTFAGTIYAPTGNYEFIWLNGTNLIALFNNMATKTNWAGSIVDGSINMRSNGISNVGYLSATGTITATNSSSLFYEVFRRNTSDVFQASELITADAVDKRIAAMSAEIWYGTTNAHAVLAGKGRMESLEPATMWAYTNALTVGTNLIGTWSVTNTLYQNRAPAGEYLEHFHLRVIQLGNPDLSVYSELIAISADGATTNLLDSSTHVDVSTVSALSEFDSRLHVSTNSYFADARYLAINWYGVRSGGSSASLVTAGGGGLATSLRTPNISNPSIGVDSYYLAVSLSNTVYALPSNAWNQAVIDSASWTNWNSTNQFNVRIGAIEAELSARTSLWDRVYDWMGLYSNQVALSLTNTFYSEGNTNSFSFTNGTAYIAFRTNYLSDEPLWIAESNLYLRLIGTNGWVVSSHDGFLTSGSNVVFQTDTNGWVTSTHDAWLTAASNVVFQSDTNGWVTSTHDGFLTALSNLVFQVDTNGWVTSSHDAWLTAASNVVFQSDTNGWVTSSHDAWLTAASNVVFQSDTNGWVTSSHDGFITNLDTVGTGTSLVYSVVGRTATNKSLAAGSNITITDDGVGTITLASTGGSGGGGDVYQVGTNVFTHTNTFLDTLYGNTGIFSRVGIGTNLPAYALDVYGEAIFRNNLRMLNQYPIYFANGQTLADQGDGGLTLQSLYNLYLQAGVGGDGSIKFYTGTNATIAAASERGRFSSVGYFGLGTTNPIYLLDVNGESIFRDNLRILSQTPIYFVNGQTLRDAGDGGLSLKSTYNLYLQSGASGEGAIKVYTGSNTAQENERMRILSTGNIGIGTTNPVTTLDVNGTSTFRGNMNMAGQQITNVANIGATTVTPEVVIMSSVTIDNSTTTNAVTLRYPTTADNTNTLLLSSSGATFTRYGSSAATAPTILTRRGRGLSTATDPLASGSALGSFTWAGITNSGGGFSGTRAQLGVYAAQAWDNTSNGTYMSFSVTPTNSATMDEALRIQQDYSVKFFDTAIVKAPATPSGGFILYSSNGFARVIDETGDNTQFSPHNEKGEIIKASHNPYSGVSEYINLTLLARAIEEMLPASSIYKGKFYSIVTNAPAANWAVDQNAHEAQRNREIADWDATDEKDRVGIPRPKPYIKQPEPAFLSKEK